MRCHILEKLACRCKPQFSVGDRIRVTNPASTLYGAEGEVYAIHSGYVWARVTLDGYTHPIGFRPEALEVS